MSSEAFVTLATSDAYALGALVLAQSIRHVGTTRNLVVLITNHLSDVIRKSLETSFDEVIVVDELNSNDSQHLELLARPELGITFTKINCWLLEQYSKCVFLDSDCLVLKEIDDLFDRDELSAAPDAGWPDCFNSGVFVYQPSKQTFQQLVAFASQQSPSFDGGDQGLLNSFFSNWGTADLSRHLPFTYNVTANAFYSYLPAVTRFRNDIHIIHFAGPLKPWQLTYNPQNQQLSGNLNDQNHIQRDFLLSWWKVMQQNVWPKMQLLNQQWNSTNQSTNEQKTNATNSFSSLNYANLLNDQSIELGSAAHRRAWESGHIDYFGRDSFSNIQQQLEKNIQHTSIAYHPANTSLLHQSTNHHLKQTSPIPTNLTTKMSNSNDNLVKQQQTMKSVVEQSSSSMKSNENTSPLMNEHQSNSIVKSTIVTGVTQGTAPTLLNSSSSKQLADTTNSNVEGNSVANKSSQNVSWLFDQIFFAITYTISMCYLLFLVAIGRSKNTNIIHGNGPTVRNVQSSTTTNETKATK